MRSSYYFVGGENRDVIDKIYQHEIRRQFEEAEKCFYDAASRYKSFIIWRELIHELQTISDSTESQIKIGIVYLLLAQLSIEWAEIALEKMDLVDFKSQKIFLSQHFKNAARFFRAAGDEIRADATERRAEMINTTLQN